jgi:peroxiredoxin Q/BCP
MRNLFGIVGSTLALAAAAFMAANLNAGEAKVKVGDKAPTFESKDENGKAWKSADHVGKKIVVLYFYPADFTGGCTAQGCGFRDDIEKFKNVEIIGVSGDTPETHAKFKKHHKLPFTLLADEKGEVAKKFGVPTGKGGTASFKFPGGDTEKFIRGATIQRYTVVIGPDGNIAALDQVKNAGGDSKRILEVVEKLNKK